MWKAVIAVVLGLSLRVLAGEVREATLPAGIGVNIHFTDPRDGELDQLSAAGFRCVRMDFDWAGIEREKGQYDFSAYDRLLKALQEKHIRPYFILDYSNPHYDDNLSPHTDAGREAFANFAAAAVHHFKGHDILWEMYNEPNIFFWRPTPNVDQYAKLALAVGKAIHEAEPDETYIGPATSTIDLHFIEACFKAGCLQYWSAISVHPYRQGDPETVVDEYRKLRLLIHRYAPQGKKIPIISGEWGYSSAWEKFDDARQAKYLPRELLTNVASGIPLSIWYDWHEDGTDPKEGEHHFGIVRYAEVNRPGELYEPKPAYDAAKLLGQKLGGRRYNKRLWTGKSSDWVLLFKHGGPPLLAAWSTEPGTHEVTIGTQTLQLTDTVSYIEPQNPELFEIAAEWTRLPPEIFAVAPGTEVVTTHVTNPFERPITILVGEQKTALAPGQVFTMSRGYATTRSQRPLPIETTLSVQGLGDVTQYADIVATNPLQASIFPAVGGVRYVKIDNPEGEAFRVKATLRRGDAAETTDAEIVRGESQTLLKYVDNQRPGAGKTALLLIDEAGQRVLETEPEQVESAADLSDKAEAKWTISADGDAKVKSEQKLTAAAPPDGPPAPGLPVLRIDYSFDPGWKFVELRPDHDLPPLGDKAREIGLWIHGDASQLLARIRLVDSAGQTFQPDGGRIDWTGWKYVPFSLAAPRDIPHWGGPNDGIIHGPLHISTLLLLDNGTRNKETGTIYVSAPTVILD